MTYQSINPAGSQFLEVTSGEHKTGPVAAARTVQPYTIRAAA